jgi:hypothetical protein
MVIDIVQSLWIGPSLPPMQALSIRSFLACGHEYHLYTYQDVNGVPRGTRICDAAAILPRESIFCYRDGFGKGTYGAFSDLFRYKLVFERGGWWVDTDLVCLEPFDFADALVFATEHEDDLTLQTASCAFKSPAKSDYLDYCLKVCESKDKNEIRWSEIGPYLLGEAIGRFGLQGYQVAPHIFNPVDFFVFRDILAPEFDMSRLSGSYAVHLWNQMWKSHDVDIETDAPPDSLYGMLKRRY